MSATTYEQTTIGREHGIHPVRASKAYGEAFLAWLARVGERSAAGRAAASLQRLNALSDDELARLGLRREELVSVCFGWRGLY